MDASRITIDVLKNTCIKLGYKFFENGDYNLNIIGIRSNPGIVNKFDDFICVAYKVNNVWQLKKYTATVDPGISYLLKPINDTGTALLKEGQYRGAYKKGLHKGKPALVQVKKLPLYRDNDKDSAHDFIESTVVWEMAGINIHRASPTGKSVQIDNWSAGCQVIAANSDMEEFLALIDEAIAKYGDGFTYTLINEKDLVL